MNQPRDPTVSQIADVQGAADHRRLDIDRVGIKGIRHPVRILDRSGGEQHTVAAFSMYVHLPHAFKGTHMSRFVEILCGHEREISLGTLREMLREMCERLEAQSGYIEMHFPFFMTKAAPVSGVTSLMDYEASYIGELTDGRERLTARVQVPVTSLCPCSKKISARGAHVTIAAQLRRSLWIEELIELAEAQASCGLYGLLKRPDEKYVTERAYDNPKFVEDLVRDVAGALNRDDRVAGYVVEAENFESIHNHSAYARIEQPAPAA